VIRTITAVALVLAAGALVPLASGAKPGYTVACGANSHSVTLDWPGGTDVTSTTARLVWPNGAEEFVNVALPKRGTRHTYTWASLGSGTGPLWGVEARFYRNNGSFAADATTVCL
jgi:hypothetical protein